MSSELGRVDLAILSLSFLVVWTHSLLQYSVVLCAVSCILWLFLFSILWNCQGELHFPIVVVSEVWDVFWGSLIATSYIPGKALSVLKRKKLVEFELLQWSPWTRAIFRLILHILPAKNLPWMQQPCQACNRFWADLCKNCLLMCHSSISYQFKKIDRFA